MDPLVWIVLAMTVCSGFFSMASYSFRAFRRVWMEEAFATRTDRRAFATLDRHLAALRLTASLCRSVCNLVLVVAMVYLFGAPEAGWGSAVTATLAAAAIIAVVGVAIPHAWSAHAAESFVAATLPVMMVFRYLLLPVIAVLRVFDLPVRRLAGAEEEDEENGEENARQEILHAASEGRAEGTVDAEEVQMIASVIHFADTDADEIMTPRTDLFALPVDTPWEQARAQVVEAGHTRVPIYEGDLDNIIGILYAKDMLQRIPGDAEQPLRTIMRKPFFVPETKSLDDLLREFKTRKVHMAVVLDEYGGTAGIVTIEDVLEEIVGEIADEYDAPEPAPVRQLNETALEVDGRTDVDDLNELLDLQIPDDEDYDTVAGFIFSELGYVPATGETMEAAGASFTVEAADERKIKKVRVEKLADTEDADSEER